MFMVKIKILINYNCEIMTYHLRVYDIFILKPDKPI